MRKSFVSLIMLMLTIFCLLMFSACGGQPEPTKLATDDGTLNHQASCETNMQYTITDFNNTLGSQNTKSFSSFDGMRFTFFKTLNQDGVITIYYINGLSTSEGMNFSITKTEDGVTTKSQVITITQGNIYTRTNSLEELQFDENNEAIDSSTKTYRPLGNSSSLIILKNQLSDFGFENILCDPQAILNKINSDSINVLKHENNFMLTVMEENVLSKIVYANFDENKALKAVKFQIPDGSEYIVLSGFNGTINFPDFSKYEQE